MADQIIERTFAGRTIQLKAPTDLQMLQVGRLLRTGRHLIDAEDGQEPDQATIRVSIEKFSIVLDIIDSMIVNPADVAFLEERITAGKLDLVELMDTFKDDGEDEQPRKPVKKVAARKATNRARRS